MSFDFYIKTHSHLARLEFLFMSRTTTRGHPWKVSVYWVKYLPFWKRRRSISPDLPWSIFSPQFLSSSMLSQVDWSTYRASSLSPNHLYTCSQLGAFRLCRASFLKGVSQVEKKTELLEVFLSITWLLVLIQSLSLTSFGGETREVFAQEIGHSMSPFKCEEDSLKCVLELNQTSPLAISSITSV